MKFDVAVSAELSDSAKAGGGLKIAVFDFGVAMKLDVDERADELALEIWNHLYRKTADLRLGYTEECIRRVWSVTKVLAEIEAGDMTQKTRRSILEIDLPF